MINKIRLSSLVTALILFFLPWINLKCQDTTLATQTGVEAAYGGASMSDSMKGLKSKSADKDKPDDGGPGMAPLVAAALLSTLLAVVVAAIALRRKAPSGKDLTSIFSGVALALLVVQMMIGFPAADVSQKNEGPKEKSSEVEESMNASMVAAMNFRAEFTMVFYLELLALAMPVIIMLTVPARKKEEDEV